MYRRIHNAATYSITINWVNMMDGCLPLAHHIYPKKNVSGVSQPGDLNLRQLFSKPFEFYFDLIDCVRSPHTPIMEQHNLL
jgi:hypothetical protein